MTPTESAASPARSSRWIMAPLLIVIALGIAWSGLWLYLSRQADAAIVQWMEREAKAGRVFACGSRQMGGFPFRIEMRCSEPSAELRDSSPPMVLRAAELLTVSQVYTPNLLIAEVTGPLTISAQGAERFSLDAKLIEASLHGLGGLPERFSAVFEEPRLSREAAAGTPPVPLAGASRAELHLRLSPGSDPAQPVFDIAGSVAALTLPGTPATAAAPLNSTVTASLRGANDFSPKPFPERLRAWQANKGRLAIENWRTQQGDALAVAKGDVGLTPQGAVDGTLAVTLAGFDALLRQMLGQNSQSRWQAGLLAGGLALLGGQTQLEGKRAMTVPLRFDNGAVAFGPLPLGRIAPLF